MKFTPFTTFLFVLLNICVLILCGVALIFDLKFSPLINDFLLLFAFSSLFLSLTKRDK